MTSLNVEKRILVIEDDNLIRNNIVELLQDEGYEAVGAENGKIAIDILMKEALPSLIILDIMMPVMDGWQFRNHQTSDSRFKEIPVIVITAEGNAKQKAEKMNASGWVKKPIDIEVFVDTVKKGSANFSVSCC